MKIWCSESIEFTDLDELLNHWSAGGWDIHSIVNANPADLTQHGGGAHNGWVYVVACREQ